MTNSYSDPEETASSPRWGLFIATHPDQPHAPLSDLLYGYPDATTNNPGRVGGPRSALYKPAVTAGLSLALALVAHPVGLAAAASSPAVDTDILKRRSSTSSPPRRRRPSSCAQVAPLMCSPLFAAGVRAPRGGDVDSVRLPPILRPVTLRENTVITRLGLSGAARDPDIIPLSHVGRTL
jgi:hypothetical protein